MTSDELQAARARLRKHRDAIRLSEIQASPYAVRIRDGSHVIDRCAIEADAVNLIVDDLAALVIEHRETT